MSGKLFVVSACSGAGKTTLVSRVIERLAGEYTLTRIVTYTTKTPRQGEVDGIDYHFLSSQEFEKRVKEGFFLEWSNEYGAYYGSSRLVVEELSRGKSSIVITDVQGALSIAEKIKTSILIWISVPHHDELKLRLLGRNSENNEQILERISISFKENEKFLKSFSFKYTVLNDCIENAVLELESIVKNELKKG